MKTRTRMKLVVALLLVFVASLVLACVGFSACWITSLTDSNEYDESSGLYYSLNSDKTEYTVTGMNEEFTSVVVPAEYNGLPVTAIWSHAFYECESLESVTIGENVNLIREQSFCGCTSLTEINYNATNAQDLYSDCVTFAYAGENSDGITVTIGANVERIPAFLFCPEYGAPNISEVIFEDGSGCKSIGKEAFAFITSLTSITIPESVETLEFGAFYNCTNLTEINYNAISASDLTSGNDVFNNVGRNGEGVTIKIGANVERIPAYLFDPWGVSSRTPNIAELFFEEDSKCESIGANAFSHCETLTSIVIPDSVTSIGDHAFYGCTSLASVTIGEGVTSIDSYAFYNCIGLTEINFNATNLSSLGKYNRTFAYAGQEGNGITVTIAANVGSVPDYIFCPYYQDSSYTPNITSVIFEEGSQCAYIGDYAFCRLPLVSVEIPDGVESIGQYAFYSCTSLSSLTLNEALMNIGEYAFYGCSDLASDVIIPDEVETIATDVFAYCSSVTYVKIGASVTTIGDSAFRGCTALASIDIPDNVESIGSYAFRDCSSLTTAIIGDGVTTVGSYSFYDCTSLTSLTIGENVASLGTSTFYECTALTEIHYNAVSAGDLANYNNVFRNAGLNGSGITLTIGAKVEKIPSHLFTPYSASHVPNITVVIFEPGCQCNEIAGYAFRYTSSISAVYYGGTAEEWSAITVGYYNSYLTNATRYYYSETANTDGSHWHYEDGVPMIW